MPKVAVLMGSESDRKVMARAGETLEKYGLEYEMEVTSAHRTPEKTREYARTAEERGIKVIIAGAGAAAHLPGAVAAHTRLPVIGVPLAGTSLGGLDALLSIVQMPKGVPVATMAIGEAGAINAAILAVQILASEDEQLASQLRGEREGGKT
jgi:phosphoribosylaminoimidazole carboxylase PurE protein